MLIVDHRHNMQKTNHLFIHFHLNIYQYNRDEKQEEKKKTGVPGWLSASQLTTYVTYQNIYIKIPNSTKKGKERRVKTR